MVAFDLKGLIAARREENVSLHEAFLNPQFAKVLKTLAFDKNFVRGQGAYLFDSDGEPYLDFISGYGVHNLGRNHPVLVQALKTALDLDLPHMVQMDAPLLAGLLAERLVAVTPPSLSKVFFTNSGTEAVEAALKLSRAATGRREFAYAHHGFHGLTLGALSANGCEEFRKPYEPLLPGVEVPFNDLEALEAVLKKKRTAAFIVEPVQGKGLAVADDDYLPGAQQLCRRYGTLFIVDEVQTGFGRTGKWFALDHWGVEPDLITVAKSLSGGLVPVGAVLMSDAVYGANFSSMEKCVIHSSTFGKNPLAMICGLAVLEVLEREDLPATAARLGDQLRRCLEEIGSRFEMFQEVRGRGLMLAVQFQQPKSMKLKMAWKAIHAAHAGMFGQLLTMPLMEKHRILTQVSGHHLDSLKVMPPLIIGEKEINIFCTAFEAVLGDCHEISSGIWETGLALAKRALGSK